MPRRSVLLLLIVDQGLEQQGNPFSCASKCMECIFSYGDYFGFKIDDRIADFS